MAERDLMIRLKADGSGLVGEVSTARAEIDKMHDSVDGLQKSAQTNRDAFKGLDDQLARFMSKLSPAYNAVKQLDTGHDLLTRSLNAGLLSHKQYDEALVRLTAKYGPAAAGAAALTGGHGLLATNTAFATREMRALFDELSSGRDRQAIGTMTLLTTRMLGLGGAGLAALAGVAALSALLAVGVAHYESTARALSQIEGEFTATGRAGLLSSGQIKGLVDQLALLPGMSRAGAHETIAALAAVPSLSGPIFQQLAGIVDDFAFATGKKAPAAAQELARAMEDPLKGAQALDKQFNLLTADQLLHIETLTRQGRVYEAHQVLAKALEDRFKSLHQNALTPLQGATNELGNAWDRLMKRLADSSVIQGAYAAMVATVNFARRAADTSVMTASFTAGAPAPAPSAAAAVPGPSWDQQHQTYIGALEIEIKTATAVADSYRGVGDQLRTLLEQRALLQSAMIASSITGDREASIRIGRGLSGNRAAIDRITGTDYASEEARRSQTALERAHEQDYWNTRYASIEQAQRRGMQQSAIGGIADPIAQARAQLQFEQQLRLEDINNLKISQDEKDRLIAQSYDLQLARQRELDEHLKPEYQKNLDAWGDNNRLMRDSWNSTMLAVQKTGEDMFVQFVTTGKVQIADLARVIEAELARAFYRQAVGSSASGGLLGWLFSGSRGGGGGGGGGGGFDDYTGTYTHAGGTVGSAAWLSAPSRSLPAATWRGAPRLHRGLASDEFPAILQKGETVLPRGTSSSTVHAPLHIHISAPGAEAGVETRIRSVLHDELPQALYMHRRALMGLVNDQRREGGRGAL